MKKFYPLIIFLFFFQNISEARYFPSVNGISVGKVNCYEQLSSGEVLVGTSTGLFLYSQNNFAVILPASIHGVNDIAEDNSGNIWLATTHGGLMKLGGMQIAGAWSSQNSIVEDSVLSVTVDASGVVYFGTLEDFYKLSNYQVSSFGLSGSVTDPAVIAIEKFQNQIFTVVKDSVCIVHPSGLQKIQNGHFGQLFPLENGELFMGDYMSTSIAYKFNGAAFIQDSTFTRFVNIVPHYGAMRSAFYYNGDYFYNSTRNFYRNIPGDSVYFLHNSYLIDPDEYYSIIKHIPTGEVLVGSSDGLYVYDFNNTLSNFGNNITYIDYGEIRVPVNSQGNIFNDLNSELVPMTTAPANSQTGPVFIAALWFSGLDASNNLHLAASRYGANGRDFFPGAVPINLNENYVNAANNRVWKINRSEINYHIANWNSAGYLMPEVIQNWPAHGDPLLSEAPILAPFKDMNQNGLYEPQLGDYPVILGDQAIYFIYNDYKFAHTESNGLPLNVEIHGMAYVIIDSTDAQTIEDSKNTVFFHYTVNNRSLTNYHDFRISLFTDFDIGNSRDDYMGCDTVLNCYFGYNGDAYDEDSSGTMGYGYHPPAMGVTFLSHEMLSFMVYNNTGLVPWYITDPQTAMDYYNIMHSFWINGSSITYGNSGYGGTQPVSYMYPGNPWNPNEWSDATSGVIPYDRRGVATIGPENFPAGQSMCFEFAYVFDREDSTGANLENLFYLKRRILRIRDWYDTWTPGCLYYEHDFINSNAGPADDTLYSYIDTCLFDPYTMIDSAWIENISVSGNTAFVDWTVVQFPDTFHLQNVQYVLSNGGTHFFVLAVLCNSGYRLNGDGQNNVWYFSDISDATPTENPAPDWLEITVYPNPSSGLLSVYIPDFISGYSMLIYDMTGKLVYTTKLLGKSNSFDFSYFSKGVYFMQIPEAGKSLKWIKTD
ncbi:MAG: T9SS type A sorting domain-containing protein [Bacteroidales bacterium]|nr:T9SS type A sorting domain-containing protein [Bacteroidales bacterium]